jgi:60 kDa SS-A/Ro ribonucleoprotein
MAQTSVPQSEPLNERQVPNNAGGFVFAIDDWGRLDRFLILGSDAPTYYQTAKDLTKEQHGLRRALLDG